MEFDGKKYAALGVIFLVLVVLVVFSTSQMKNEKLKTEDENNTAVENMQPQEPQGTQNPQTPPQNIGSSDYTQPQAYPNEQQQTLPQSAQSQDPYDNNQQTYKSAMNKGDEYLNQRKYNEAIKEYYNASNLSANNNDKSFAMFSIANCYSRAQSHTYALQYYEYANNLNPSGSNEVAIADAKEKTGDIAGAKADCENIIKKYQSDITIVNLAKLQLESIAKKEQSFNHQPSPQSN